MLEIVDCCNFNRSCVCSLLIDASKAFDRVISYTKLFSGLLKRNISPVLLLLLILCTLVNHFGPTGVTPCCLNLLLGTELNRDAYYWLHYLVFMQIIIIFNNNNLYSFHKKNDIII